MNAILPKPQAQMSTLSRAEALLLTSSALLRGYADELAPLKDALRVLIELGDAKTKKSSAAMRYNWIGLSPA
jgi:hypothetical protein